MSTYLYDPLLVATDKSPTKIQMISESTFWQSNTFTALVTLAAAAVGGLIAFFATKYQADKNAKEEARRHWGMQLIDLYEELYKETRPLYDTWTIGEGDVRHMGQIQDSLDHAHLALQPLFDKIYILLPEYHAVVTQCENMWEKLYQAIQKETDTVKAGRPEMYEGSDTSMTALRDAITKFVRG